MRFSLVSTATAIAIGCGTFGLQAQVTVATYYAALGPQDYRNSSGAPLRDFGAILQQDRANYHRFNRRDPQDQGDPIFGDAGRRAMIPALFAAGNNDWWKSFTTPPTSAPLDADVLIVICTRNNTLSHIIVNHSNGDGYNMCEGSVSAGD